jgi:signal transduction histidine kinase
MSYILNIDPRHHAKILKFGIAAIVAVMILGMWGAAVTSIYFSRAAALADMQFDGTNLAFAFDDEVTHTLDSVAATMDAVANRMRAPGSDMNIYAWSKEIPITTGPIIEGSVLAPNGMLIAGTKAPDLKPIDMSDREHFEIQRDGGYDGLFIGKPVDSRTYGQMVIPISKRVETADGRFVGVLVFLLAPAKLTTLYKSINLGKSGSITLVGTDNVILARFSKNSPEGLDGIGNFIKNKIGPDDVPEGGQGFYIWDTRLDHVTRLYSYRRVAGYPLVVSIGLGYDEGLESWWANAKTILALAAIATLLLGGLALYLAGEIGRRAMRDIELAAERSNLKIANTELQDSKKRADVANHAKTLFLANMSHELRTPLNAIIGFSQIIKDGIMGPGKPLYAEYAKDIFGAGEHLLEIINNLLDISKIEAGKIELSDESIDPSDIVRASVAALRVQAAKKKIALTADIPPGTPFIHGDTLRLRQVLINLVSNAVKFTPEGGRVTMSAAFDPARGFSFTVTDTGIGMSPKEVVVALELFGQIENAIIKKHEGTGLGLPLAQHLVELHGGRIEIESIKGVGTTVHVRLPLDRVVRSAPDLAA